MYVYRQKYTCILHILPDNYYLHLPQLSPATSFFYLSISKRRYIEQITLKIERTAL